MAPLMIRHSLDRIRQCEHRREKFLLAVLSAGCSGIMIRTLATIVAMAAPADSWAADLAHEVIRLTGLHYWLAMGFGAIGGVASLFHELRTNIDRFSLTNALGHMFISQFAALLAFVGTISVEWSLPVALGACGLAGWMGAAGIARASDAVSRRMSILIGGSDADDRH